MLRIQPNRFLTTIANRPRASILMLIVILLLGVIGAFVQAKHLALEREEALFDRIFDDHKHDLGLEIGRVMSIPEVLETSKTVRALLLNPDAAAVREQNEILEKTARNLHVDVIYVMDRLGNTLAASNWREPDSFVGKNYAIRPYFKQALAGGTGRYIAKGMTSLKLGYYLSHPVMDDATVRGVVVAKVALDENQSRVEQLWRRSGEIVIIADEHGVVCVSPLNTLLFKMMQPIPEAVLKVIETSRQYGGEPAPALLTQGDSLSDGIRVVDFKDVPNHSFLQKSFDLPDLGLRLYLHIPTSHYWEFVLEFTGMFSLLALVIFLASISIFQRWAYGAKLLEAAIRDPLTGLNTRLYMNDWCNAANRTHNRDPSAGFGLAVFDLDLFKQINDAYGHLAGDAVLKQVGAIIRNAIRGGDLAVRFGGEELAVFAFCAGKVEAVALAERIRSTVEQTSFQSEVGRMPVTVSGGVAYHNTGETINSLFARADKFLYEAKETGRNRICA